MTDKDICDVDKNNSDSDHNKLLGMVIFTTFIVTFSVVNIYWLDHHPSFFTQHTTPDCLTQKQLHEASLFKEGYPSYVPKDDRIIHNKIIDRQWKKIHHLIDNSNGEFDLDGIHSIIPEIEDKLWDMGFVISEDRKRCYYKRRRTYSNPLHLKKEETYKN